MRFGEIFGDCGGGIEREIARKHGETTQHRLLSFRKKLITPV
jgi:hypothetical protein